MKNLNCRIHPIAYQKRSDRSHQSAKPILVITLLIILSACSSSPMLVRIAYERIPSKVSSELDSLADLNQTQLDWIHNASRHFHNWHRTTQLPIYVAMLDDLADHVQNDRTLNLVYFDSLMQDTLGLIVQINQCSPAMFASEEMKKLTDKQVDQIRQNLQKQVDKGKAKYTRKTREERSQSRFSKIKTLLSYAKLNLNDFQQQLLKITIDKQVSLGVRRFELTELWNMKLISILQGRARSDFSANVKEHLSQRWQLIEDAEPDIWTDTQDNWRNYAAQLMESLSDKQRKLFGAWLAQMSRTLNTLANEKLAKTTPPSPLSAECSAQPKPLKVVTR